MFAFVARQPILDKEKEVFAYELFFRDGKNNCFPDKLVDASQPQPQNQSNLKLALDDISCQKTSFINFTNETILKGLPNSLDPNTVVVEVSENVEGEESIIEACQNIRDMGFQIALNEPKLTTSSELLSLVNIVKIDTFQHAFPNIAKQMPRFSNAKVKMVADNVDTLQNFISFNDLGFDYFQGYFFSKPVNFNQAPLPVNKLSLVELIGETANESFGIDRINEIIERDVGLSYMLLRFINNPMINKRFKITSLKHALNYMGEVEIKKFIALLALANLADDKPMELLHMSLVRAKFCDLIAKHRKIGDNPPTGFMAGLFSLLDALLDQDMQELVNKMPIVDEVKYALCGGKNDFYLYILLARAFESATWMKVRKISEVLEIEQKHLHHMFNQAVLWGNTIRQSISPHYPKAIA
ncbi:MULTISPECIES: EAL and HDOD domain-containing protein [Alteromonadaceae]|uniref:EAL and HDOD domain-containing protein n=1 Tax=Alteromonadaceae TaxID=72275 RepID=UPI001C097564|nr:MULTISPECIES: HDOD domain-containing protein [Aliiglaciecola]MBU2878881.1 HDOD domain-containing protein [Aliiglaciecola lipolytica]MDO6713263.1 HDOD domain-containing protein [Aliiglaciecola sp. 2_MG-2023]MDO6754424.1 HDOD domain-containing protein [Aliiglaciecola sp. 1_MG-2023]